MSSLPPSRFASFAAAVVVSVLPAQRTDEVSAAALRAALPETERFVVRGDTVLWTGTSGKEFRVKSVQEPREGGGATVELEDGPDLAVSRELLFRDPDLVFEGVPPILHQAEAAGAKLDELRLRDFPLLGLHLGNDAVIVLPEGLLTRDDPDVERPITAATVATAVEALSKELDQTGLSKVAQQSLRTVLELLERRDERTSDEAALDPSFARRLVRHGWLDGILPDNEAAAAVTRAVRSAETFVKDVSFRGSGGSFERVSDAFGNAGFVLRTPERAGYTCTLPAPQYLPEAIPLQAVVWVPAAADPVEAAGRAIGVDVLVGPAVAVSWKAREDGDDEFTVEEDVWRLAVPDSGGRRGSDIIAGVLPPHVLLVGIDGDVHGLVTRFGRLTPPRDASPGEAERFVTEAANVLPDAAYLDLIGEYMFRYVFDSPDPRHPTLIGARELSGEIHQTAEQTLANTAGGISRGDCDDIAELYQRILEKQGKLGHLMQLPGHCALGFARKREEAWHTYVLQTGPPLEFEESTLPESLVAAYQKFSGDQLVDPHQLGISLRFSGENTRSDWVLSYRIFAEPEYAETMIDVQRDWHFHTYQRGFVKMRKMVAVGDDDTANYRELSGLCQSTGQFAKSAEFLGMALDRVDADELETTLNLKIELVADLLQSDQKAEARKLVEQLLDRDIPKARERLGPGVVFLGIQLASLVNYADGDWELAVRVLKETAVDIVRGQIRQVERFVESPMFEPSMWTRMPQLMQARQLMRMFVAAAIGTLQDAGSDRIRNVPEVTELTTLVAMWIRGIAFRDVDEPGHVLRQYALTAEYYQALIGRDRLLEFLDGVDFPKGDRDHTDREAGLAQLNSDLPWIRLALYYWTGELMEQFERDRKTLDRDLVQLNAKRVAEAHQAAEAMGLLGFRHEAEVNLCNLISALVREDADAVAASLKFVRELDDKSAREDAARWLGYTARFLSLEWYGKVIELWREYIDFKPSYFEIAWAAAHHEAPKHAMLVADVAAERFADDSAFVEERKFMRELFAGK